MVALFTFGCTICLTSYRTMELSTDSTSHPIMQLRDDVLNFLEAVDAQPGSEINKTGFKFARLLKELHETYQIEFALEHIESCFYCPDYVKPSDANHSALKHPKRPQGN